MQSNDMLQLTNPWMASIDPRQPGNTTTIYHVASALMPDPLKQLAQKPAMASLGEEPRTMDVGAKSPLSLLAAF